VPLHDGSDHFEGMLVNPEDTLSEPGQCSHHVLGNSNVRLSLHARRIPNERTQCIILGCLQPMCQILHLPRDAWLVAVLVYSSSHAQTLSRSCMPVREVAETLGCRGYQCLFRSSKMGVSCCFALIFCRPAWFWQAEGSWPRVKRIYK
jgi:hypothetical protein